MNKNQTRQHFDKLGLWYILALVGIAGVIIISQVLIQQAISEQQSDARVINLAGRQRMLSQQISKNILKVKHDLTEAACKQIYKELEQAFMLWKTTHQGLLHGNDSLGLKGQNSKEVKRIFRKMHPHYQIIAHHTEAVLSHLRQKPFVFEPVEAHLAGVLAHEQVFLKLMNEIVFQYNDEAQNKISSLRRQEVILLLLVLLIIFLEAVFIFLPTSKNVKETVMELVLSENTAKKMAKEIEALYGTLEVSYQQLADVDIEPEQPTVFVKTDVYGNVRHFSEKFRQLLGLEVDQLPLNLYNWLEQEGYQRDFLDGIMAITATEQAWNGELKVETLEGDFVWLKVHIIPTLSQKDQKTEVMVVAANVTELKEAKEKSKEINREKIEKQVEEKKYKSILMLEGQEEERKRIARDIHDGIGQMLIALKLTLESTSVASSAQTTQRVQESLGILSNIIKEVRRVAFNLTPSSLNDFGLPPAIKKFCQEVGELMGINITFENKTHFINRLNTNVETHIYRIVQEGVNNAIKHANASEIQVVFAHSVSKLNVEIVDNGIGFDYAKVQETGHFAKSGHGIFNIRERANFIDGQFEIETMPEQGTKIKVGVPIN